MGIIRNFICTHKWLFWPFIVFDFIIIFLPQWLDSVWSLSEKISGRRLAMPDIAWVYWITIPVGIIMFGIAIWAVKSGKPFEDKQSPVQTETASQIFDSDLGRHINKIKKVLGTWKQQLSKMIRQRKLVELRTDIEIKMANKNDFWYFLTHCPSVEKEYEELRARREIYTMHLNPFVIHEDGKEIRTEPKKEHIAEQRKYLNEAMQSLIKTIDHSLSMSYEYSKRRCPFCPSDMTKT